LTIALAMLTVGYIALSAKHVHWSAVSAIPSGSTKSLIGALIFAATALGLGWVNSGADYSRYLPRRSSSAGVVWWTTFGGSIAPIVLIIYGLLLAGSDPKLNTAIASDPIGALTQVLPTWYLVPFVLVAVFGLVAGAVLDIYSSGLALLTLGLPVQRWQAALVDGVIMVIGTIWVVFFAANFFGPFQGFLITLGVPITAWCGIFLADLALRRREYVDADLYSARGRYGKVRWVPVLTLVVASVIGWGLVTNGASGFRWQGYLLDPFGLGGKTGSWAFANLGVAIAFVLGFVVQYLAGRAGVRAQEARPVGPGQVAQAR
jgi:purine-cytosine permease-like protein